MIFTCRKFPFEVLKLNNKRTQFDIKSCNFFALFSTNYTYTKHINQLFTIYHPLLARRQFFPPRDTIQALILCVRVSVSRTSIYPLLQRDPNQRRRHWRRNADVDVRWQFGVRYVRCRIQNDSYNVSLKQLNQNIRSEDQKFYHLSVWMDILIQLPRITRSAN